MSEKQDMYIASGASDVPATFEFKDDMRFLDSVTSHNEKLDTFEENGSSF
jgi:hypothetical protein